MLVLFVLIAWIWMVIGIVADVFARRDIGGWGKAAWCLALLVLPVVGSLVYVVAHHDGIAGRRASQEEERQRRVDAQFQSLVGAPGPAEEIERAERLLIRGTITDEEFDALKAKALAAR
jgi:hypothetical protein